MAKYHVLLNMIPILARMLNLNQIRESNHKNLECGTFYNETDPCLKKKKETKCHENEEGWEVCSRSLMLWFQNPLDSLLQITRAAHTTSHSVGLGESSSVSISDKFPSGADAADLGGYP